MDAVGLRWIPLPAQGDLVGGALVSPLRVSYRDLEELSPSVAALPIFSAPSLTELTDLYEGLDAKVVLFGNNSVLNFQSLISSRMLLVHINHGKSDKQSMASNNAGAYDRVFVAGAAAVQHHTPDSSSSTPTAWCASGALSATCALPGLRSRRSSRTPGRRFRTGCPPAEVSGADVAAETSCTAFSSKDAITVHVVVRRVRPTPDGGSVASRRDAGPRSRLFNCCSPSRGTFVPSPSAPDEGAWNYRTTGKRGWIVMTTSAKKAASKTTLTTTQTKVAPPAAAASGPSLPVLVPGIQVRRIPLPRMGVPHVPTPRVPVPHAVSSRLPKSNKEKLVWFGGLAGMAALGVINWPVAGVVAAGTYIAERGAKAAVREELAATAPDTTHTSKGSTG